MRRPRVSPWIGRLEIRCKILSILVSAFFVISLEEPRVLSITVLGILILVRLAGLPWGFVVRKLRLPLPFLLFMGIPLVLGEGFPIPHTRLLFAYQLITKGIGVFLLLILLVYSQKEAELVKGLHQLPIPKTLSAILLLSFRYVHLWGATLKKTYRASISRGFERGWNIGTLKVYGEMMGGMILRSLDQSNRVHRTMVSRGFRKDLPVEAPKALGLGEGFWVLGMITAFLLLKALEMRL